MSSLYNLLPQTYETAKGLRKKKKWRQRAFTYELTKSMFQPKPPEKHVPVSHSWVKCRAENHRQRGLASFVHLLWLEHGSIPQLPARTTRAKRPAMSLLTHVNGAAKERAFLKSLLNDFEEVGWCLLQLIPFCNSTGEVLKTFSGGATRERLVRSVQPARKGTHTCNHQTPYFPLLTHTTIRFPILPSRREARSCANCHTIYAFNSTTAAVNAHPPM